MILGERCDARDNSFNFLRFAAASLVIFSHSYPIAGSAAEPFHGWVGQSGGALAVYAFFAISGFLIAKSWCDRPDLPDFLRRRALRILPGLAAATLFAVLIVGPLVTRLPLKQYFADPLTRAHLGNVFLHPLHYALPGVFASNPLPGAVNGSLWSLPVEALMYLLTPALWGLGFCLGAGRRAALAFVLLGLAAFDLRVASLPQNAAWVQYGMLVASTVKCMEYFAVGALFYAYRERIALTDTGAALAAAALWGFACTPAMPIAYLAGLPYLTFWAAYRFPQAGAVCQRHDISYGLYVYAFPIQQLCMHWFPKLGWAGCFAVSYPLTFGLAWLSWKHVEKPCLRFARKQPARAEAPVPSGEPAAVPLRRAA